MEHSYKLGKETPKISAKLDAIERFIGDSHDYYELEGLERINGELVEYAVERINGYLKKDMEANREDIKIEDFNIFTTTQHDITNAHYDNFNNRIILPKSIIDNNGRDGVNGRDRTIRLLVHEMFHSISASNIKLMLTDEDNNDFLRIEKGGYTSVHLGSDGRYDIFSAFNEGVTEYLTSEAFGQADYFEEVELVNKIIKNIYPEKDGLRIFTGGYLNGDMMHLRKIEKFYGFGSLRLLANLQTKDNLIDFEDEELLEMKEEYRKKVLSFFIEEDEGKRIQIRKEIDDF